MEARDLCLIPCVEKMTIGAPGLRKTFQRGSMWPLLLTIIRSGSGESPVARRLSRRSLAGTPMLI
jgi:hypothetical protein